MFQAFVIGQYIPGNSFIHCLDPRAKLAACFLYFAALFCIETLPGLVVAGVFVLASIFLSRLPVGYFMRGLKPVALMATVIFFMHLFFTSGQIWWQWGAITLTGEGFYLGVHVSVRLMLLVVSASILTFTTSPVELTDGLENILKMGRKFGIPYHQLAMMLSIALRFIPILASEADKIVKAQIARGWDPHSAGLIERAKMLASLLVSLLVSAFRRAEEISQAMETRCYAGGRGRTRYKQYSWDTGDWGTVAFTAAFAISLAVMG